MGLMRAVLKSANLERAILRDSDLSRVDLEFANLKNADLTDASLRGAALGGANSPALRSPVPISSQPTWYRQGSLHRSGSRPPRTSTRRRIFSACCANEVRASVAPHLQGAISRGMRSLTLVSIALELIGSAGTAQDRRGIRFWNLTLYTITISRRGKPSSAPSPARRRTQSMRRLARRISRRQSTDEAAHRGARTAGVCPRGGCTEALMLANGFTVQQLVELVRARLATPRTRG